MKLGINIGYSGGRVELPLDRVLEAEQLGYDSLWTAEAYGSDAVTPLAYLAAKTSRIKLGTGIMQLAGRTPAMCAMTMSTLDALAGGGRVLVGLGLSGPQVVEGWHGQPYDKPVARLREYVNILRQIWAREKPVVLEGKAYQVPYRGADATGLGKPLKSILHGRQLPIYVAAIGPQSVRQAAEIADGWLPIFWSPIRAPKVFQDSLQAGFKKAGGGKSLKTFDIAAGPTVIINNDVKACLGFIKPVLALYVGGMGARGKNFYNDLACRYGFESAAKQIQDLYLDGKKNEAIAAVPDELADEVTLCGPKERIRDRLAEWKEVGITTMILALQQPEAMRT